MNSRVIASHFLQAKGLEDEAVPADLDNFDAHHFFMPGADP
jgi:hypothetical protein